MVVGGNQKASQMNMKSNRLRDGEHEWRVMVKMRVGEEGGRRRAEAQEEKEAQACREG